MTKPEVFIIKAIVFIHTQKSGSSREAIKAAERLGYYTIVFTKNLKLYSRRKDLLDIHYLKFSILIHDLKDIANLAYQPLLFELCLLAWL